MKKIKTTNYKIQITNKMAHELHELPRISDEKETSTTTITTTATTKGSHGLHQDYFKLQTMTALIKSFCGGVQGGSFFKKRPPWRRRHKMDNNVYNRVLEHVMGVTDEQFAGLSVAGLACSLQMDRFKLSRQFKSQSAMTLEEFLFKEKMSRAAFLLKTFEDITVKEVSRRIGFCTCDYFIRRFKQYYGVAPGRYKEFKCRIPAHRA